MAACDDVGELWHASPTVTLTFNLVTKAVAEKSYVALSPVPAILGGRAWRGATIYPLDEDGNPVSGATSS